MAKAKAKKAETKEKKELTYEDYSKAVLLTGFVGNVQKELAKTAAVSDVRFVPFLDGYHIYYTCEEKNCRIAVTKNKYLKGYKVRKTVDGLKKVSCSLKSKDDYEKVIARVFGYKTEKKSKKKG